MKHQKATTDVVKGQAFTKVSHMITIAVREGGGITDPNLNFRLRLAMEKARAVNMPKENIQRAIERGKGEDSGGLEPVVYEGYGPGAVAVYVEAATDNRQRTAAAVKHAFEHGGGTLASPGAVGYLFERSGVITVSKAGRSLDEMLEVALAVGAADIVEMADVFEIYSDSHRLEPVKQNLEGKGIATDNTELIMRPASLIELEGAVRQQLDRLIEALEALDDVQRVYSNVK